MGLTKFCAVVVVVRFYATVVAIYQTVGYIIRELTKVTKADMPEFHQEHVRIYECTAFTV